MPQPPPEGSKRERMIASFDALQDSELPALAERYLKIHASSATERSPIEDLLWTGPEIPRRFRREVARALEKVGVYGHARGFDGLLDRLFILDDDLLTEILGGTGRSLRERIDRHVFRNPDDWSAETLFENLGAFEIPDARFARFLEGLASADVRPDEASQREFVAAVNVPLRDCGVELRESGSEGGYPVFTVISLITSHKSQPKNLIFASSIKPDLRLRDAISNDVEIVTHEERVLVYDRPIGIEGLTWSALQSWWAQGQGMPDGDEAKRSLYLRLRGCLPNSSPPQLAMFESYYRAFGSAIPGMPALLPEVWLHWDPKTVADRGAEALFNLRMDFLLLLPRGIRVVVEVDGRHHYAGNDGKADPRRYSSLAAGDRELKLAGYQVFRFGAEELQDPDEARPLVRMFFTDLFKQYSVIPK